jgi:ABC-type Fe3+-siderophore transport system permease subunit
MDSMTILKDGATASLFAKFLTDIVKNSPFPTPSSLRPLLAMIFSFLSAFLLFLAGPDSFSRQSIAAFVLVGIAGTAGAMVATMTQTVADKVKEREQIALDLPKGSTSKDVTAELVKTEAKS